MKVGLNPNSPKMKRKVIVRWKVGCGLCLKCRHTHAFKALAKEQKKSIKDYLEDHSCNFGFPLCLQFDIVQTELNFGNNIV